MTTDPGGRRILGTLRAEAGRGAVRMEDRFPTPIDDLWSAITDPERLLGWLGEVEGDLRLGGEYRAHYFASGWRGTGRIVECEPPHHARIDVVAGSSGGHGEFELWLTAAGDETTLVWEERGMPLHLVAAYGAGIQIHVEDLATYLAGGHVDHREGGRRWEELSIPYEAIAESIH